MEREIIIKLAIELAKRDREDLCRLVSTMKFEDALKKLNGFNLNVEPITMNGKFILNNTFFDVNYKSIATTIFMTPQGGCEVYDTVDVWIDDIDSPILYGVQP
jgi:hypothetical protein